jgi:hypothetical protein
MDANDRVNLGRSSVTPMPMPRMRGSSGFRARAAAAALERPRASSNKVSNERGRRESGYNAEPNARQRMERGYNAEPNPPRRRERGYNAESNARQPLPRADNNNVRSNPPGSAPMNSPDTGNTAREPSRNSRGNAPAEIRGAGRETIPLASQEEPRPAYTGPPPVGERRGRGDSFSRATARARARLRNAQSM